MELKNQIERLASGDPAGRQAAAEEIFALGIPWPKERHKIG